MKPYKYDNYPGLWEDIPKYMWGGINRYVMNGIEPGSFLKAVLENNLVGAVDRADGTNKYKLVEYADLLYNVLPNQCWGSPQRVNDWISGGGLEGLCNENSYPESDDLVGIAPV
jgi:hypothetical protein